MILPIISCPDLGEDPFPMWLFPDCHNDCESHSPASVCYVLEEGLLGTEQVEADANGGKAQETLQVSKSNNDNNF